MRNNPDDLANQLIQKVKDYLQEEVDNTELDEDTMESAEEGILVGRRELAESLLNQIDEWENENEE
tara:strand:- start:1121 stop:1318 length:198 start_codon:yes stop_codon:yes gene_type:complete